MKYLVAGGAGFLGINLCLKLLEAGNKVICVDNFSQVQEKYLFLNKIGGQILHLLRRIFLKIQY